MYRFISAILLGLLLFFPQTSSADNDKSAILIPGFEVRLAFTSNIIRRKIARESGELITNPVQALALLNDEGFDRVYVMPTHMIPGEEFDEIQNVVQAFRTLKGKYGFNTLKLGRPFMNGVDDCEGMADLLLERFKAQLKDEHTAIVLMGHGTPEHFANALYSQLQLALDTKAYGRIFVGTVEAAPKIDDVIAKLKRHPEITKLVLSPLMIVAGDHAHNDLAGEDDPESWINILKAQGYKDITTYLVGLGQDKNLARKFESKIRELKD